MLGIPSRFGWPRAAAQSLDARRILTLGNVGLAALLGVQAARLVWILAVAPGGYGTASQAVQATGSGADLTILSRFDAFFRGGPQGQILLSPEAPQGAATTYQLFGVRTAPGGGSAIIAGADGRQTSILVGESLADGAVLVSVGQDHAVIRQGGQEQRLEFTPTAPSVAPPPVAVPAPASPTSAAPATAATVSGTGVPDRAMVADIGLQPRRIDGRIQGFTYIPRGNAAALTAAGLRSGDVIISVNGQTITAENQAELMQDLRQAPQATLGLERNGQPLSITLGNPDS